MNEPDWKGALGEAFEEAVAYLQGLPARPSRVMSTSRRFERLWVAPCRNGQWSRER